MTFSLNTNSGYLHRSEVHEGGENSIGFERADEADLYADRNGITLTFCKQCFPGNRNIGAEEEEIARAESAMASRDFAGDLDTRMLDANGSDDEEDD